MSFTRIAYAISQPTSLADFAGTIINLANDIARIAFIVAFLGFIWGTGRMILNSGSADKLEEAKKIVWYGVLALFIAACIWGITILVSQTFFPGRI